MILADMKAFFRRLEQGSDEELMELRTKVADFATRFAGNPIEKRAKTLVNYLDEELLSRKINPRE
ncbi:hypothetical protein GALL_459980 [mine drainage metagenome]|uniref:Uncharacterized protein n=1 Tax=mine drainage metagenome TaxID=410659 RepID=A0A1J5PX30_9ZZZZ